MRDCEELYIKDGLSQMNNSEIMYCQIRDKILTSNDKNKKQPLPIYHSKSLLHYIKNAINASHSTLSTKESNSMLNVYQQDTRQISSQIYSQLRSKLHTAEGSYRKNVQKLRKDNTVSELQQWIVKPSKNNHKRVIGLKKYRVIKPCITNNATPTDARTIHQIKMNCFITKCEQIERKASKVNQSIRVVTTPYSSSKGPPHKGYSSVASPSQSFAHVSKVFIYGKEQKGRYIKGKYDDVVGNCYRVAHADERLVKEYSRMLNYNIQF